MGGLKSVTHSSDYESFSGTAVERLDKCLNFNCAIRGSWEASEPVRY